MNREDLEKYKDHYLEGADSDWKGKPLISFDYNVDAPKNINHWVGVGDNIEGVHGFGPDYETAMKEFVLKFNKQAKFKIVIEK
jgi:hypothetical protein